MSLYKAYQHGESNISFADARGETYETGPYHCVDAFVSSNIIDMKQNEVKISFATAGGARWGIIVHKWVNEFYGGMLFGYAGDTHWFRRTENLYIVEFPQQIILT